jgi:hypothetical protein
MLQTRNLFTIIFATGAVLLIIGLILSYYPNSVIVGLQANLRDSDFSQQDKLAFQGSLDWWRIEQLTVYQPISYLLSIGGIIIMVYAVLSKIFSIATNATAKKP